VSTVKGMSRIRQTPLTVSQIGLKSSRAADATAKKGYRLLARQCICNAKTSDESRSVCYGALLSSALGIVRRLNMDDFATDVKHTAIDCAFQEAKSTCLEAVTTKSLRAVCDDVAAGEQRESAGQDPGCYRERE
jgi:hypothetical protein